MKTIREFAKLCGTTEKTLRYYDRIGILRPDYTDPENGYRYYTEQQKMTFKMIRWYKSMGFTMNEIQKIYRRTGESVREMVRRKRESLMAAVEACDRWTEAMDASDRYQECRIPVTMEVNGQRLVLTQGDKVCSIAAQPEILEKCREVLKGVVNLDMWMFDRLFPPRDLRVIHTWEKKGTVKEILASDRGEICGNAEETAKLFLCSMKLGRRVEESEGNAVRQMLLDTVYPELYGKNMCAQDYSAEETDMVWVGLILLA